MVKLVTFHDAGDKPVYVNPVFVTFIERPAVGMFGNTTIHFGGDQLTVKEEPEAVVAAISASNLSHTKPSSDRPLEAATPPDVIALPDGPAAYS